MIDPKCVVPECFADTFFIEIIRGFRSFEPNHKKGKTKVFDALENDLRHYIALGIIDKDPHASVQNDFSDYSLIDSDGQSNYLKLYKHKNRNHHIIEINKEFEFWLFNELNVKTQINLSDYSIPVDYKDFCKYFKSEKIRAKKMLKNILKNLIEFNQIL